MTTCVDEVGSRRRWKGYGGGEEFVEPTKPLCGLKLSLSKRATDWTINSLPRVGRKSMLSPREFYESFGNIHNEIILPPIKKFEDSQFEELYLG